MTCVFEHCICISVVGQKKVQHIERKWKKSGKEDEEDNQPFVNIITHPYCTDLTFLDVYLHLRSRLVSLRYQKENGYGMQKCMKICSLFFGEGMYPRFVSYINH